MVLGFGGATNMVFGFVGSVVGGGEVYGGDCDG